SSPRPSSPSEISHGWSTSPRRSSAPVARVAEPRALPPPAAAPLPDIDSNSPEARREMRRVVMERFPDRDELGEIHLHVLRHANFVERARFIGDDGCEDRELLFWAIQEAESTDPRQVAVGELQDGEPIQAQHPTAFVMSPMKLYPDFDQENFVMECAMVEVDQDAPSFDGNEIMIEHKDNLLGHYKRNDGCGGEGDIVIGESLIQTTPAPSGKNEMILSGERSGSMDYCEGLLRSVDLSDSENEEPKEEEFEVLPPEAIHILQSETLKRSLLKLLNQAQKDGTIPERKAKWGPMVTQQPATRGHGNVNIMEKVAAYKRKKKLKIPKTFKGAKVAKYTLCFGSVGRNDQAMENPMFRGSRCASSPVLKAVGPPKRGID
uniref:Uncharacterized protein n=2 Tax=Aegilops tauschii subsp. strangulata TaxID=200361 RepID=A0A453C7V0_AEGTS